MELRGLLPPQRYRNSKAEAGGEKASARDQDDLGSGRARIEFETISVQSLQFRNLGFIRAFQLGFDLQGHEDASTPASITHMAPCMEQPEPEAPNSKS